MKKRIFGKDQCKVLYLGRSNQAHKYKTRINCLGSCSAEKDLGIIVSHKLNISQQNAAAIPLKKGNFILGYINRSKYSASVSSGEASV